MTNTTPRRDDLPISQQQKRILLIDGLKTNQLIISMCLEKLGIQVDIAQNSTEAIQALTKQHYKLILINCLLHPLSGHELCQYIRNQETPEQHIIIIALTANSSMDEMLRCAEVGMDDVLPPPFNPNNLLYCLERWKFSSDLENTNNTAPTHPNQIIKKNILQKLQKDLGSEFKTIFKTALQTLKDQMNHVTFRISQLKDNTDEDLTRHLHSFKSTSATLGSQDLYQFIQLLENHSSNNDPQTLKNELNTLEQKYQQLTQALEQWYKEYNNPK